MRQGELQTAPESILPPNSGTDEADLANGDSAVYIRKMGRRLTVLDTRFDTILPTLATKTDLIELKGELKAVMSKPGAELRIEMHASRADIFKWMAAMQLTIILGFSGMIVTMFTLLRPG